MNSWIQKYLYYKYIQMNKKEINVSSEIDSGIKSIYSKIEFTRFGCVCATILLTRFVWNTFYWFIAAVSIYDLRTGYGWCIWHLKSIYQQRINEMMMINNNIFFWENKIYVIFTCKFHSLIKHSFVCECFLFKCKIRLFDLVAN